MEVSPPAATPVNSARPPGNENPSALSAAADFETFLTLLTTQLKNQDPLKPLESTQFVAQLASFSAVEQQVRTNDALKDIQALLGGRSTQGLAAWLGSEVRAKTDAVFAGTPLDLFIAPEKTAERADLVVRDQNNQIVQRLAVPLGAATLPWAGVDAGGNPLPDGTYKLSLESFRAEEVIKTTQPPIYARVTEARIDGAAVQLVLNSGVVIDADSVSAIRGNPGGS
jgi:flagellar basal-body rod modification protein FlgD